MHLWHGAPSTVSLLVIDLRIGDDNYWIAHAGIPTDESFEGITIEEVLPRLAVVRPDDLLWRLNDTETMLPVDRPIIMGHLPRKTPLDAGHVIAIDTGAAKPVGRLTAVVLPERRFVTVGRLP